LRGLITLALGLLFLLRPGTGVGILVAAFAGFCFIDGALALAAAISGAAMRSRAWLAIQGVLGVFAGVVTLAMPGNVAVFILFVIAFRALIMGLLEIVAAIRLGHSIPSPWLLGLVGVASMAFGALLLRNPAAGLLALAWLVGWYGLVLGATQILASLGLRSAIKRAPPLRPTMIHT
ncbi:MAG: HdeD family acid-resistance protein, partial [Polyangia bacterium]